METIKLIIASSALKDMVPIGVTVIVTGMVPSVFRKESKLYYFYQLPKMAVYKPAFRIYAQIHYHILLKGYMMQISHRYRASF